MKKNVIWKILIYFIIYSVLGFLIETIYAIFTKGLLESRKSFLYGPFCIVYGIGAIILILFLNKYKKQNIKLFVYGMILGCSIEYFSSLIGEMILHAKWWDYSNDFFNIGGRTCFFYAVCWGFLSILLINYINPIVDKAISNIYKTTLEFFMKFCIASITVFMFFDGLISCYAIDNFLVRVSNEYNIKINGVEDKTIARSFSNEKMMMTYPNIIVVNENDENIYLGELLSNIKNYYYKF